MSPVLTSGLSVTSGNFVSHVNAAAPVLPVVDNTLSKQFSFHENRTELLQAKNNNFLEMHPNGVRGVNTKTKYCVLLIAIFSNFKPPGGTAITSGGRPQANDRPIMPDWSTSPDRQTVSAVPRNHLLPQHVIMSNETRMYLCMDDKSVVYQTSEYRRDHCTFYHNLDSDYRDTYYRKLNDTTPEWFLGLNKDGSVRCGNVTERTNSGASFAKHSIDITPPGQSPPFKAKKAGRTCCKKNNCRRRKNRCKNKDECPDVDIKCVKLKERCKRDRRKVFELDLKRLKKYYNKCIDPDSYFVQQCRKKKSKSSSSSNSNTRRRRKNRKNRKNKKGTPR